MSIFNLFSKREKEKVVIGHTETEIANIYDYLNFPTIKFDDSLALNISTVYTACKILADDVGSFPINVYKTGTFNEESIDKDGPLYELLHYNPNPYTSSNVFFSTLEYIRNITGNAFARINKDYNGYIISFEIINPYKIAGYKIIDNTLIYTYKEDPNSDITEAIEAKDILHFRTLTSDGIWGINPIEKLRLNLSTTYKAFTTIDKFYDNNATSPKALKTTVPEGINPKEWQHKIADFTEKYGGFRNAGKVISLPPFTELQDITLSFAEAEFISTIKFNVDQIAGLFKVPPHLLGNFESSKFNNLEQLQLSYKINTLRPILRMYRQELEFKCLTSEERKAGKSIEFVTSALVETDSKTRMENYKSLFGMAGITPNQICTYEGYPTFPKGDEHFIATGYMGIDKATQVTAMQPNKVVVTPDPSSNK